jgi:hypothetical protein
LVEHDDSPHIERFAAVDEVPKLVPELVPIALPLKAARDGSAVPLPVSAIKRVAEWPTASA